MGAEPPLTEMESGFLDTLWKFARDVMRPTGQLLDRMTPDEVAAPDSPYWEFRRQYLQLGLNLETLASLDTVERARLFPMALEVLGWADSGLAISCAAGLLPSYLAWMFGNQELLERFDDSMLGSWGITEPDHGSDSLDPNKQIFHAEGKDTRPNCVVRFEGDELVVSGQKSAWVSNGTIAEVCILYAAADTGDGPDPQRGCVVILPLDSPGVSRGKPLDKLGQRALNQGEIFFDDVRLSRDHLLAGPDDYQRAVYAIHCEANGLMGAIFTGVAQAAYDLALDYAHERKQGGVPIIRHQNVAYRLFHMARKVEASRALTRRVALFNNTADIPALHAGMMAKVTATQTAFEVASDSLQIFGGNGLTREHPIEKILRDARASMIEDGCNEVLAIKGGYYLMDQQKLA
jgi:alkylation response protein AidB-like acyl-CoA dehydrogenase